MRRLLYLGFLLLTLQSALAISYTVQVAALSDEDAALALQQSLREEGYPAYLVSVPSESGTIFRLRVGAFADRAAAQTYAESMRGVGGTAPVPALAEGIPAALFPLEPTLMRRYPNAPEMMSLMVVPWGEGTALRTQGRFEDQPFAAEYRVLREGADAATFTAWRAAPQGNVQGTSQGARALRVHNVSLWPEEELSESELETYTEARLEEVARSLELTPEQVRPYIFQEPGRGAPYLILAEQFNLTPDLTSDSANAEVSNASSDGLVTGGSVTGGSIRNAARGERYRALGNPIERMPLGGPSLTWFDRAPPEGFPTDLSEPLFDLETRFAEGELSRESRTLSGDGWSASARGDYTQLSVGDRSWRAVVGYPLWAGGDYLLVYTDVPVLYKLVGPQRDEAPVEATQ